MRLFIICIPLMFTSVAVIAQSNTQSPTVLTVMADWLGYTDTASGISVKYPKNWRLKTTNPRSPIVLHAPSQGDDDAFSENLNYIISDLTGSETKIDLYEVTNNLKKDLGKTVHNFLLLEEKKITWLDSPAFEFSYTGSYDGSDAAIKVKILQRLVLVKNRLILVTYTAEGGKPDVSFNDAVKIINQTILKK